MSAAPRELKQNTDSSAMRALMDRRERVAWSDGLLVVIFCLLFFGFAGFSGRPLTMHEARLPQTSREMLRRHEWLLPTSGTRPWLERPPLPHWFVIGAMNLFAHDDRVWIVRLPSAVMGTITVLMTMLIATRLFGRNVGIVSALVLATCVKFWQYATLAEDDIFLAALVAIAAAIFIEMEFSSPQSRRFRWFDFFTYRSWRELLFFSILGLTNLTKGPLLGLLILGTPVGIFSFCRAIVERSWSPVSRYCWLWGWTVLIALTLAWPLWAYHVYPDVLGNWKYDYLGRMSGTYAAINEPWWYYPPKLLVGLLPWAPACLVGVWIAWKARAEKAIQWIVCWSIVPLLVLSIPSGKHDHYLVPFLAPWAILAAIGLERITRAWQKRSVIFGSTIVMAGLALSIVIAIGGAKSDHTVDDTSFLIRVRSEVPPDAPLYINGKLGPPGNLDFFRTQFYSRPDAILIHNLSFLRDQRIAAKVVYVITRQRDESLLTQLGTFKKIDQSPSSHENFDDQRKFFGNFTLYELTFYPNLHRYPAPSAITSLQAMERAPGPWCGPEMH